MASIARVRDKWLSTPIRRSRAIRRERVNVLGVGVSAITMADALALIDQWIATGARHYVCVTGVHGVMESQSTRHSAISTTRAGLVTPDGMPLVWLSWLWGYRHVERVYGPDLMLACCRASVSKGYRHFFYGGSSGCSRAPGGTTPGALPRIDRLPAPGRRRFASYARGRSERLIERIDAASLTSSGWD